MPKVPRPAVPNPVCYIDGDISLHDKHWEALLKRPGLWPGQGAEARAWKARHHAPTQPALQLPSQGVTGIEWVRHRPKRPKHQQKRSKPTLDDSELSSVPATSGQGATSRRAKTLSHSQTTHCPRGWAPEGQSRLGAAWSTRNDLLPKRGSEEIKGYHWREGYKEKVKWRYQGASQWSVCCRKRLCLEGSWGPSPSEKSSCGLLY